MSRAKLTVYGRTGRTRTCDPLLRRQMLYPAELRSQTAVTGGSSALDEVRSACCNFTTAPRTYLLSDCTRSAPTRRLSARSAAIFSGSFGTTMGAFPYVGTIGTEEGLQLARVVLVDVIRVLQDVAREDRHHVRVRSHYPAAVSFLIPASVAAEAGSQPMPHWPMIALASAISCSVTLSTTPLESSMT